MYPHTAMHRPIVTRTDTHRDEKETARRAAFPQPAGRFRWWWQVLGSNQRRLSRRVYRPLPLATRATCQAPPCEAARRRITDNTRGCHANHPAVRRGATWTANVTAGTIPV